MNEALKMDKRYGPIKLARTDELKISAIVKALKEFISSKYEKLLEKNKIPKANADYIKKLYFSEIDACKMDIKHAFIMSNGLVYPLLKALGNCALRAITANDKRLMLIEALAVFEKNIDIVFQGGTVTMDFQDIMNQSSKEEIREQFVFRGNVSNSSIARELESGSVENSRKNY